VLSDIFINKLDDVTDCTYIRFVDYIKLGGAAEAWEGCAAIQRDLNRLEEQASRIL